MKVSVVLLVAAGVCGIASAKDQPKNDVCPHPFIDIYGRCLFVNNFASVTWEGGRSHCQGFGGELVTLDEANLLADIVSFIRDEGLTTHSYWIGGADRNQEGDWEWTDGTPVKMGTPCWGVLGNRQQPQGGTNENCLGLNMNNNFHFNDFNCDTKLAAICEYKF